MHDHDHVEESKRFVVHMSIQVALVAVYLYDYIICLSKEIELMWLRPFRASTILYFAARYLPFAKLLFVLAVSHKAPPHCTPIYQFVEVLGVGGRAAIVATLIGRTYAICNRKKLILVGTGTLGIAAVVLGMVEVFYTSCIPGTTTFSMTFSWAVVIGATRLVLEAAVISLLLYKSHADFKFHIAVHRLSRKTLSTFIFRTGVMYFVTTFCLEILAIFFNLKTSVTPDWLKGITNALPLPIPAILISRFLLDLRYLTSTGRQSTPTSVVNATLTFSDVHVAMMEDFGGTTVQEPDEEIELEEVYPHGHVIPIAFP